MKKNGFTPTPKKAPLFKAGMKWGVEILPQESPVLQNRVWGFTLLETAVAMSVFAVVVVAGGSIFAAIQQTWQKQKITLDLIRNSRWAMELMCNELRQGSNINDNPGGIALGQGIRFQPYGGVIDIWYWRGDSVSDTTGIGDRRYLYRGVGNNIGQAYGMRQQLANLVADNPVNPFTGNPYYLFDENSGLVTIWLTVTDQSRSYTLKTLVRSRE